MRRVLGTAHTSPGLQVCAGRKICRPAMNRATSAPAMKNGRYGSSLVRFPIHAPLKPRVTRTNGPRQQVDARIAAKPPTKSVPEPVRSREFSTASTFICAPLICSRHAKSGNGHSSFAALYHNSAEPNAAHAQVSGDLEASFAHR
jgi:hypothetical protein